MRLYLHRRGVVVAALTLVACVGRLEEYPGADPIASGPRPDSGIRNGDAGGAAPDSSGFGGPQSDASGPSPTVDAAGPIGPLPGVDPLNAEPTCTSGERWTRGENVGSPLMNPGVACIDCHTDQREGPDSWVAGTVYPSGHEPDLCNGVAENVVVEVTDANGQSFRIEPNEAGNFMLLRGSRANEPGSEATTEFEFPYSARVFVGDRVREMVTDQTDGDCNRCHTSDGIESAPGRITLPM